MSEDRHIIWSNFYLDYDDWKDDLEADYPDLSEQERIALMYEINGDYLDDERMNLNVQLSAPILVIGDLGLWHGRRMGYKEIASGKISDCLYIDTDYATWYVDRLGDLRCDAIHHDGTNHYLYRTYPGARIFTLTIPGVVDVSSTELRERLARGGGEHELAPAVYGYILRQGLYGTQADLEHLSLQKLRPVALSYLKYKRIPHVLGTEQEAIRLAERYGADVHKARVAALLHDCTKKLDMEEQLALCRQYQIPLDDLERKALKLLHAKTGAAIARDVFGVDDEIYSAIFWHTTGKADMTLLEKIIYLADYIEPSRDFPGVEKLRKACYEDLDAGLLLGLEMSVEEMESMGNPVHVKTLEARDYLKGQREP